ncbi:MAG: hypothetical protein AB7K37_13345 [Cyclobacteriaceae bacterium]
MIQTFYDIVKAHGGELKVESTLNEQTVFRKYFTGYMRYFLHIILTLLTLEIKAQAIFSKDHNIDSHHARLKSSKSDIEKITAWNDLANHHKFSRADSGLYYASMAISLSRRVGYEFGELIGMAMLSLSYTPPRPRIRSPISCRQMDNRTDQWATISD